MKAKPLKVTTLEMYLSKRPEMSTQDKAADLGITRQTLAKWIKVGKECLLMKTESGWQCFPKHE